MSLLEIVNALPDAVRYVIFPALRVIAAFHGYVLWEDGSLS